MMLLSSASTCCSCHTKVPVHGNGGFRSLKRNSGGSCFFYSGCNGSSKEFASICMGRIMPFYESGIYNSRQLALTRCPVAMIDGSQYVETSNNVSADTSPGVDLEVIESFADTPVTESAASIDDVPIDASPSINSVPVDASSSIDGVPTDASPSINTVVVDASSSIDAVPTGAIDSVTIDASPSISADSLSAAQDSLNSKLESISVYVKTAIGDVNKAADNVIHDIVLFFNKSGESAEIKLTGLATGIKETSSRVEVAAVDVLRNAIVFIEGSVVQGGKFIVSSYGYAKQYLPQEFQDVITSSEESADKVLHPVGSFLQQVYAAVGDVEESLGLDPNDPLIQLILFLGVSLTLWGSYRALIYGGYSGDLSPESVLELLKRNENAVLVDIRPEELRERDGIPDLRRKARFRYASVTQPEVDGSVRAVLKGGRELEDSLLAVIIRNLKIADDSSVVLVLDSDGSRSKGVARSLRKLGTKRTYLVQGGFRSWVEDGFRIKMPKPETFLTVLNEETEAIIEDFKPTPLKLFGYGLVVLTAAYALLEWERTLQIVGVIGLGQSIYRRVTSYEDADDFKEDVRLLLTPVRLGVEAISRATGGAENGLPTSPQSSSDVQSRVLQAAAKHESQPEETQDNSSGNESVNPSEA